MDTEMPAEFGVSSERVDEAYVVAPTGELDLETVEELRAMLGERPPACSVLVLDLRGLTFFDTSGMRLVVETTQRAQEQGLRFFVVRGSDDVQRLFGLAKLEARLPFVDDPAEILGHS
jgi:anti-anti-sigma factor